MILDVDAQRNVVPEADETISAKKGKTSPKDKGCRKSPCRPVFALEFMLPPRPPENAQTSSKYSMGSAPRPENGD
jgi:hypothetical protein